MHGIPRGEAKRILAEPDDKTEANGTPAPVAGFLW